VCQKWAHLPSVEPERTSNPEMDEHDNEANAQEYTENGFARIFYGLYFLAKLCDIIQNFEIPFYNYAIAFKFSLVCFY